MALPIQPGLISAGSAASRQAEKQSRKPGESGKGRNFGNGSDDDMAALVREDAGKGGIGGDQAGVVVGAVVEGDKLVVEVDAAGKGEIIRKTEGAAGGKFKRTAGGEVRSEGEAGRCDSGDDNTARVIKRVVHIERDDGCGGAGARDLAIAANEEVASASKSADFKRDGAGGLGEDACVAIHRKGVGNSELEIADRISAACIICIDDIGTGGGGAEVCDFGRDRLEIEVAMVKQEGAAGKGGEDGIEGAQGFAVGIIGRGGVHRGGRGAGSG